MSGMKVSNTGDNLGIPCERCQHLEFELNRLERIHAERLGEFSARGQPWSRLTRIHPSTERGKQCPDDLEIGQAELNAHRRIVHGRWGRASTW